MSALELAFTRALAAAGERPFDGVDRATKKNWSQRLSNEIAVELAGELRGRGMRGIRPAGPGEVGVSGAERRLAGGIGAKKVDVSWATEESGLLFAASVKTFMFPDSQTKNFQKNLTNRRGDLLFETVTLHRRFPFAVVTGFVFFDLRAASDGSKFRKSTFENAFARLTLFSGRPDPSAREEQLERLYLVTIDFGASPPDFRAYDAARGGFEVEMDELLDDLVGLLAARNSDEYEVVGRSLRRVR